MESFLLPYGLPALFGLSFLAATILPMGSEWFFIILLLNGTELIPATAVAAIGNFLGGLTTYLLGRWGSAFIQDKVLRISSSDIEKAQTLFNRFGIWSLLFSWLPIIGDPLCFLAGMFKTNPLLFSLLVLTGKASRYYILGLLTLQTAGS